MKSKNVFKLAALFGGVAFFILLIRFGLREDSETSSKARPEAQTIVLPKKEPTPKDPKSNVTSIRNSVTKRKQIDSSAEEFLEKYKRFRAFTPLLTKEDKKCAEQLEQIIPGEDFIDSADDMYKDYGSIIEKIQVISSSLYRPIAIKAYQAAEEIAFMREFENSDVDVMEFYSTLANINTCRDPKVLNYMITAMEAANKFNWPAEARKKLISNVLTAIYHDLNSMPTALNLSFSMHAINSMLELGFVSDTYRSEVEYLVSEVMEHQVTVMERLEPGGDRRKSIQELLFDFEVRKGAAGRLNDILSKIQLENEN
jgi:hypothetical protein